MEWNRLKTFYYVAKYQSFKKASEELGIAISALSRSISLLEHQLKTMLFYRNPTGVSLTKEGQTLLNMAQLVYSRIEKVENEILEEHKSPKGELRVFATQGIVNFYLSPFLPEFMKLYPDINLRIFGMDTLPDFDYGNVNVALCPPIPERKGLIQKHLFTNHIQLYASPQYLEIYGTPETPEDLEHHALIGIGDELHRFHQMNWHLSLGCKRNESRNPYVTINTPNGRLMLAEQGFGIAAASREHPGLKDMNLVPVLTHIEAPILDNYLIYPDYLSKSKRVQAFEHFMVPRFHKAYGEG
ncbi:LysR family transcriptional regulator [Candidatus Odyssella thessalonicensis]|uniref:LysR family transcriptional regulator n=1 Tax=Candidatus Odyssella thessalonicensis TaxID=84647 RepID=UPI000225BD8F|nr:LysR family transcriptional regulator [Candidatus Odyssella thessalonicensis]